MADGPSPSRACPACGRTEVEPYGVVVAESPPRGLAAKPPSDPEIRRTVERKYKCHGCGEFFSVVEDFYPRAPATG
jgi:hypothetical protein